MKQISLTQGQVTIVDDEDFEFLSQFKWCSFQHRKTFYAVRNSSVDSAGKSRIILMHREILKAPDGVWVDHIDRNGLNNQRVNIRLANRFQNQRNRGPNNNNKSGYKGVSFSKQNKGWVAHIHYGGRVHHLGTFQNREMAARIYGEVAKEHYGDFAYLNFPEQSYAL